MAANYVLLEKITVGAAGAANVTFSGIPQTGYTDLVVKYTARSTAPDSGGSTPIDVRLTFNGSSSGYSERMLYGTGSAAASAATSGSFLNWAGTQTNASQTASTFASSEIYIPNYTSSNNKSMSIDAVQENNATASAARLVASLWANSAAITSLTLSPDYGNFAQYSTFYLYGVAKLGTTPAIVPYATGGDTIMTDGTYWYHTFISSGTFTPKKSLSNVDYLVVAGGGGGGLSFGGGGGAGGLRSTVTATGGGGSLESSLSLTAQAYAVTVGAGGAGAAGDNPSYTDGTNGNNSVFSTITSVGGGGGGSYGPSAGKNGGSGGGAGGGITYGNTNGGTGTTNQGYAGGALVRTSDLQTAAAGGGGSGSVGTSITTSGSDQPGGNGGSGVQITAFATPTSTGVSSYYAAGGGGGVRDGSYAGGSGGGAGAGNGGGSENSGVGASATANTGSGGGGGFTASPAGSGGSGLVIVRYAV